MTDVRVNKFRKKKQAHRADEKHKGRIEKNGAGPHSTLVPYLLVLLKERHGPRSEARTEVEAAHKGNRRVGGRLTWLR